MSGKRKLTGGPGAPEAIAGLTEKALREAQAQRLQALQAEVEAIDDVPRRVRAHASVTAQIVAIGKLLGLSADFAEFAE